MGEKSRHSSIGEQAANTDWPGEERGGVEEPSPAHVTTEGESDSKDNGI